MSVLRFISVEIQYMTGLVSSFLQWLYTHARITRHVSEGSHAKRFRTQSFSHLAFIHLALSIFFNIKTKSNMGWTLFFCIQFRVICPPTQCNYLQIFVSPDTMWSFIQVIKVESRRRVTVARLLWMLDGKVWEWRNRKKKKSNYCCIITVEQYIRSHRRRALTQPSPCLSFCLSGNYGTGGGHPLEPGPFPQEPLGAAQSMIVLFSRTLPHETWRHRSRAPAHSRRAYMCRSGYQSRWHAAPSQHH